MPGRAVEVVDLDAGVVGHRQLAGRRREGAGLEQRVLLEGGARLLDAGVVTHHLDAGAEDLLHLLDLVGVAGGEQDPHQRGAGGSLTISCWRAMISSMPASARPSSVSSSARQ